MNENSNVGVVGLGSFGATPSPSPDGGTWVGLADDGNGFIEVFGQTVLGFDIGATYDVSWYQANFGFTGGNVYLNPDAIGLSIDGGLVGLSSVSPLAGGWTLETVQCMATATSHDLSFGLGSMAGRSYMSMDGISLAEASPVPIPAAAWLFGSGLIGLAGLKRRQKAKV